MAALAASGMTPDEFERRERQGIVEGQFQSAIQDSAIATPAELAAAHRRCAISSARSPICW